MFKKIFNSAKSLSNVRILCACGILAALFVVLYAVKLPLSPNLRITFTFIPLAIAGWLFGPIPAALVGLVGDVIGCMLFPMGAYFPGFTLSTMLTGFIFGIFLFETDITASKSIILIIMSKLCISLFINIFMNSLWLTIITKSGYYFHLVDHSVKNVIAFPFECILLWLILGILSRNNIEKLYKSK